MSQTTKHIFQSIHHYSPFVLTRCSEFQSRYSEFTQHHNSTNSNLLTAASARSFKQFFRKPQLFLNENYTPQVMLCCRHKIVLTLFSESPSFARETLHAVGTIDRFSTTFYNKVYFINIHTNIMLNSQISFNIHNTCF